MLGSFRGQLALWFGGMSLVSLVAAGFYIGRIATSDVETFGGESLYASANSATALLSVNLRERELEIDLLRHSPLFTKGDLSGSEIRHALELRKAAHNEYTWIGVAGPDGRVLQATNGLLVGQQVNQRTWFQAAQSAVYSGDIHDAALLAKHLPNLAPEQPLRFLDASLENQVAERTKALSEANHELERLASSDALTGVCNRRYFNEKLQEHFLSFKRSDRHFSLLMIDADHFKQVNDTCGHQTGDAVLQQLAGLLGQCTRATDIVARYDGEEFVVLLPDTGSDGEGLAVAENIRAAVESSVFPDIGRVTVSLGLSRVETADSTGIDIVQRADQALYRAKAEGRNCVRVLLSDV